LHNRFQAILLIIGLIFLSALSQVNAFQGQVLGVKAYLKNQASGIPGYQNISLLIPPTNLTDFGLSFSSGPGETQIGQWITRPLPININLTYDYNWLFCLYGKASSGQASLFARFFLYRNSSESFLFESSRSYFLPNSTVQAMLWQSRIKMALSLLNGDRLIFKLFLDVYGSGVFNFYYDSLRFPSYFTDPTETRYMTTTAYGTQYKLSTSENTYFLNEEREASGNLGVQWGIRIWKVNSSAYELTSGTPVALANMGTTKTGYQEQSKTWTCPLTIMASIDYVRVIVYTNFGTGAWQALATFETEALGATQLDNVVWTVVYEIEREYDGTTYSNYFFGSNANPSRITNFVWTANVTKSWHDIYWNLNLSARQTNHIYWLESLTTRQVNHVYWIQNLTAMQWNSIKWVMNLTGMEWHSIQWDLQAGARAWQSLIWAFTFDSLGWHHLYWVFTLEPETNMPVLFVGLAFFGFLALAIVGWRLRRKRI
jgi:hypothetical protein